MRNGRVACRGTLSPTTSAYEPHSKTNDQKHIARKRQGQLNMKPDKLPCSPSSLLAVAFFVLHFALPFISVSSVPPW